MMKIGTGNVRIRGASSVYDNVVPPYNYNVRSLLNTPNISITRSFYVGHFYICNALRYREVTKVEKKSVTNVTLLVLTPI